VFSRFAIYANVVRRTRLTGKGSGTIDTQMSSETREFLQNVNIRFSAEGAAEMDRNQRIVFIPHEDIVRIDLVFGSAAERPLVTIGLVIILLAVSLFPVVLAAQAIRYGGVVEIKLLTLVVFAVPAWWLARLVAKKRWHIRVCTHRGIRKLIPQQDIPLADLTSFISESKAHFGYS